MLATTIVLCGLICAHLIQFLIGDRLPENVQWHVFDLLNLSSLAISSLIIYCIVQEKWMTKMIALLFFAICTWSLLDYCLLTFIEFYDPTGMWLIRDVTTSIFSVSFFLMTLFALIKCRNYK